MKEWQYYYSFLLEKRINMQENLARVIEMDDCIKNIKIEK